MGTLYLMGSTGGRPWCIHAQAANIACSTWYVRFSSTPLKAHACVPSTRAQLDALQALQAHLLTYGTNLLTAGLNSDAQDPLSRRQARVV
eukprot:4303385-Amphidinium_carterae.3